MRPALAARHHADASSELGYNDTTRRGAMGAIWRASAAPAAWKCTPPLYDSHTSARPQPCGVASVVNVTARGVASNDAVAGARYANE